MGHRFKVYNVGADGSRRERGVIEVESLPTFDAYNRVDERGTIVSEVCGLFKSPAAPSGFTEFVHYWIPRKPTVRTKGPYKEGDIEIYYSVDGNTVFFLERGVDIRAGGAIEERAI